MGVKLNFIYELLESFLNQKKTMFHIFDIDTFFA